MCPHDCERHTTDDKQLEVRRNKVQSLPHQNLQYKVYGVYKNNTTDEGWPDTHYVPFRMLYSAGGVGAVHAKLEAFEKKQKQMRDNCYDKYMEEQEELESESGSESGSDRCSVAPPGELQQR